MKILAVCGFGVGSSMALRMQIEKACKELKIECDIDNTDILNAPSMGADLIYTSKEFKEQLDVKCDVLEIKKFMDYQEVLEATKKYFKKETI